MSRIPQSLNSQIRQCLTELQQVKQQRANTFRWLRLQLQTPVLLVTGLLSGLLVGGMAQSFDTGSKAAPRAGVFWRQQLISLGYLIWRWRILP